MLASGVTQFFVPCGSLRWQLYIQTINMDNGIKPVPESGTIICLFVRDFCARAGHQPNSLLGHTVPAILHTLARSRSRIHARWPGSISDPPGGFNIGPYPFISVPYFSMFSRILGGSKAEPQLVVSMLRYALESLTCLQ